MYRAIFEQQYSRFMLSCNHFKSFAKKQIYQEDRVKFIPVFSSYTLSRKESFVLFLNQGHFIKILSTNYLELDANGLQAAIILQSA
jgi:hypothetical protein